MRTVPPPTMRKLDRQLRAAFDALAHGPRASARVGAAVVFTGALADLRAAGFEAPSAVHHPVRRVSIAAGSIPLARLPELVALDQVISVEGGRAMKPEIDDSVPEIGARIVHGGIGIVPSLKGRGVVIGIIDSGIDFRHRTFRRDDGRTRLIALWDQTLPPNTPGNAPSTFGYGIEYLRADLDGALGELTPGDSEGADTVEVRTTDRDGHGTHVAGIAAGNGLQPGNCHLAGHFVGVAPEADLVVVRLVRLFRDNVFDPSTLEHAFEYIFTHPLVLERPVVVNYSQGDNLGPHDGTTALELLIDALVLSRPGRVVMKSVGNEGGSGRHAEVPVPMTGADLRLVVGEGDRGPRAIEAWYPGAARLSVQVFAPGVPAPASGVVAAGGTGAPFVANPGAPAEERTTVEIRSELGRPHNGDNLITITMASPSGVIPANTWTIRFTNTGPGPTTVHAWLDNDDPKSTKFLPPHVSARHTVTTPGTAKHIVTVGAYDERTSGKVGELAAFTSRGPVRRIVNPQPTDDPHRPDVVAPGVAITSAKRDVDESSCCDCCVTHYTALSNDTGTSVAAPHVAGVVALMLERNPMLSADLVRNILRQTAAPPEEGYSNPPTDDDLNTWGRGRVNALAAVELVVPPIGGGSADADPLPAAAARAAAPAAGGRPCPALAGFTPFRPALAELRRQLLGTPDGQLCAALISRHFSEARGLIRSNRRVAVAWHRVTGPAFVRALVRAFSARETPAASGPALPEPPDTFARFLDALARYGSAGLRADLDAHGATFTTMLRGALRRMASLESVA